MKYFENYSDFEQILYHLIPFINNLDKLSDINRLKYILQNGLKFNKIDDNLYNLCFTRNKNYIIGGRSVRVLLNKNVIKDLFKIRPYTIAYDVFKNDIYNQHKYLNGDLKINTKYEWEERIISTKGGLIKPKYYSRIQFDTKFIKNKNLIMDLNIYNIPIEFISLNEIFIKFRNKYHY